MRRSDRRPRNNAEVNTSAPNPALPTPAETRPHHDQGHHRIFTQEPLPRYHGHSRPDYWRHLLPASHPARRHPRPVGHPGHHLHRVAGAGTADRAGSNHLSAHDQDAVGAEVQGGARLFVLRILIRLRYLRRRHRSVLGAQPRARIPQRHLRRTAQGRDAPPRPRCHRRRLGLHVCAQLGEARPRRAALHAGLVPALPAFERRGRGRGRLGRRLRETIPNLGRSRAPAGLQSFAF